MAGSRKLQRQLKTFKFDDEEIVVLEQALLSVNVLSVMAVRESRAILSPEAGRPFRAAVYILCQVGFRPLLVSR